MDMRKKKIEALIEKCETRGGYGLFAYELIIVEIFRFWK